MLLYLYESTLFMKKYIDLYQNIYKLLENRTPLMFDCGSLCNAACCQNNGKGMLLFPYEEQYISSFNTDFRIEDSYIEIDGYTVKILFCNGICDRSTRPIACRIFPLFPFTYENRIIVDYDPRAKGTCPLLMTDLDGIYMGAVFRLMVQKAGLLLSDRPIIKNYLLHMTQELDILKAFKG